MSYMMGPEIGPTLQSAIDGDYGAVTEYLQSGGRIWFDSQGGLIPEGRVSSEPQLSMGPLFYLTSRQTEALLNVANGSDGVKVPDLSIENLASIWMGRCYKNYSRSFADAGSESSAPVFFDRLARLASRVDDDMSYEPYDTLLNGEAAGLILGGFQADAWITAETKSEIWARHGKNVLDAKERKDLFEFGDIDDLKGDVFLIGKFFAPDDFRNFSLKVFHQKHFGAPVQAQAVLSGDGTFIVYIPCDPLGGALQVPIALQLRFERMNEDKVVPITLVSATRYDGVTAVNFESYPEWIRLGISPTNWEDGVWIRDPSELSAILNNTLAQISSAPPEISLERSFTLADPSSFANANESDPTFQFGSNQSPW